MMPGANERPSDLKILCTCSFLLLADLGAIFQFIRHSVQVFVPLSSIILSQTLCKQHPFTYLLKCLLICCSQRYKFTDLLSSMENMRSRMLVGGGIVFFQQVWTLSIVINNHLTVFCLLFYPVNSEDVFHKAIFLSQLLYIPL